MRGFIIGVVLTLAAIIGGAFLSIYLGKFPIGADNPPGKLETSLANMAMDQYVERNAPDQKNPIAATSQDLIEGARAYERNCAFCHGGALQRISPMRRKFNPPVPQIIDQVPDDPDAHLFWVIKHGIRLTGMPSWNGILKDDQIWQITAFIKHSANLPPEVQAAWRQAAAPANAATTTPFAPATPTAAQPLAPPRN